MKVVQKPSGGRPQQQPGGGRPQQPAGEGGRNLPSLSDVKALRHAQKETNQRVEELKLKLFRMTDQHMDQAVNVIKRWLDKNQ